MGAFDHPVLGGLVGDEEIAALLGFDAELAAMTAFEIALAQAEAEHGVIPAEAALRIAEALPGFRPDIARLRRAMARDGVAVPDLVRQMREATGGPHGQHLHFGATSQDVIDTAFALRLKPVLKILETRLDSIALLLDGLKSRFGRRRLTGRTRMQAAIAITAGDRLESWKEPLVRNLARLERLAPSLLVIQFGGAAGTLDRLGNKGEDVGKALAGRLGLHHASQWQSQRDRPAELAGFLSTLTGSLGKLGQDVALMAFAGGEIELAGGGASSAMPHKKNPVAAEMLVTLARFNAVQVSGIHQAIVHENERSGAAWTLEWLILPDMLMAAGAATRLAGELLASVSGMGEESG